MKPVTCSVEIAAPVDVVWDLFTDLEHMPERVEGIESIEVLSEPPFRVGTRWRETRIFFKKKAVETMEVTAVEPQRRYAVDAASHGTEYHSEYRFEPAGSLTRVSLEFGARPVTFGAKLMSPLAAMMSGAMRKLFLKDMEDLKKAAEALAGTASGA